MGVKPGTITNGGMFDIGGDGLIIGGTGGLFNNGGSTFGITGGDDGFVKWWITNDDLRI